MIDLTLNPSSVERTNAYLENAKTRILEGIRVGMKEAMVELAATVAGKLHGDPIHTITGKLLDAVMRSPTVMETETTIRGIVSSAVGGKPLGAWLEDGIHEPAVSGTLLHFIAPGGKEVFSRGHRQFYEMGKPFLVPSLEESRQRIIDTIREQALAAVTE